MTNAKPDMNGIQSVKYITVSSGRQQGIDGEIVDESLVCISLNGEEVATFMCSPHDLEQLALGFLYNEGFIAGLEDVHHVHLSNHGRCVDVWLRDTTVTVPTRKIVTAGCGGGVTFDDLSQEHKPLTHYLEVDAEQLAALMRRVHLGATLYQRSRGIHTAALATPTEVILQVEDIGRHNCLDKLRGAALQQHIPTAGQILLTSGRISSEMINKARRLETPIICSRTSPTSLSVALADAWNMTIVAYLRQDRMRIYTHPERIYMPLPANPAPEI